MNDARSPGFSSLCGLSISRRKSHSAPSCLGGVKQSVGEDGDQALVADEFLAGYGLAQQGDGVQKILCADIGTNLSRRDRGLEQRPDNRFESLHEIGR